jgi:hypothetical protein
VWISAIVGISEWESAQGVPSRMPPPSMVAGCQAACRHLPRRQGPQGLTAVTSRRRAGNGVGGKGVPALAQAARATCRLASRAATERWSFLTKFFRGGHFLHYVGAGGLMCQKFLLL